MNDKRILGIDLGGTNARSGIIEQGKLINKKAIKIHSNGSKKQVLNELYGLIDRSIDSSVEAIGVGVPSVVDVEKGIVYDVVNIPSWKEVHLKEILELRYHRPVLINNDANCFALGEKYFGKGQDSNAMVGLIVGTGLGAGVIINDHLYAGPNCGAGEFGMIDYLDKNYEYYASGQFFESVYDTNGREIFQKAEKGDSNACTIFNEFGLHIGNAIKMILYAVDPECIILGGSVSRAYNYFKEKMWNRVETCIYSKSLESLRIEVSELENSGILGAAALFYDAL